MNILPLVYVGDGEFRASGSYHVRRCENLYGPGQLIEVAEHNERSMNSHRAYFAEVKELWQTLPETLSGDFPNETALRKFALIKSSYCTQARMVLPTHGEAVEAAAFVKELDDYALCEVVGRVLTVWRAKSQSMKSMKRDEFEKSKTAVLDVIHKMIGADHEVRSL